MLAIYGEVAKHCKPNFMGTQVSHPSNLHFQEWSSIAHTGHDKETVQFLQLGFPAGFEGPIHTHTTGNHPSSLQHSHDMESYICKELWEGAMLDPFSAPPFTPWYQTNPLLTRQKWDATDRQVIMDIFWTLPQDRCINGSTPRESFLSSHHKMHLPSAYEMCDIICKAGQGVSYTLLT